LRNRARFAAVKRRSPRRYLMGRNVTLSIGALVLIIIVVAIIF
jgi:hypothetical protein